MTFSSLGSDVRIVEGPALGPPAHLPGWRQRRLLLCLTSPLEQKLGTRKLKQAAVSPLNSKIQETWVSNVANLQGLSYFQTVQSTSWPRARASFQLLEGMGVVISLEWLRSQSPPKEPSWKSTYPCLLSTSDSFSTGGVLFYKNVCIREFSLPSQSCGPPALTSSAFQPPSMTKAGLAHSHALSQVLESAPSLLVSLSNQDSPHGSILPCKIAWMDSQPQSKKSRFCAGFMLGQKEKAVS